MHDHTQMQIFSAYVMFITRFGSIYLSYILQFDTPDNLRHSIENINTNKEQKRIHIFHQKDDLAFKVIKIC